jgi:hypothetical protein
MYWLVWSFIPGLHWLAWLHVGLKIQSSWYIVLAGVYALPVYLALVTRTVPMRLSLLLWLVSLLHLLMRKPEIDKRMAALAFPPAPTYESLRQGLLGAALQHEGCLSVTQGVLETGKSFAEVERVLDEMVTSGYIYKRNNPQTGVIEYVFKEVL